jgi:uncharacterized Zn-finger protein
MKHLHALLGIFFLVGMVAGCSQKKNPVESLTHPKIWMDTKSADFHGQIVVQRGKASCQTCHGEDLQGGESGVSCTSCHAVYPHPKSWIELGTSGFHGSTIQKHQYDMRACRKCHGKDYAGGPAKSSCLVCHTRPAGPEACNTCHGNEKNNAPPRDLAGNLDSKYLGVGAHQTMLNAGVLCSSCHVVPDSVYAPGHLDSAPYAEVKASLGWNHDTATCASPGCHGPRKFIP